MSRTVMQATPHPDFWSRVDQWAAVTGQRLVAHGDWGRTYAKGDGFLTHESRIQLVADAPHIRLESWVVFWMTGGELNLNTNEGLQYFARRKGRKRLDAFLAFVNAT